ncbi:MAG TPA: thioredoxin domain-containing protein [Chloroflexota bacterium]
MNRLSKEKSPYLLQHAANPVDWYPWGAEALQRARDQNRPILVSIGYSACHWCHVMERESFEDAAIATIMNVNFINIKVDREERPDVDAIFMEAVQALNGQGGWPLNVFLTPDGRPFFGGTYFPPRPAHGLPSWEQVLTSVASTYRDRINDVLHNAEALTDYVRRSQILQGPAEDLSPDLLRSALDSLQSHFDWQNGGLGGAPKFPQSLGLEFVLRMWNCFGADTDLQFIRSTLDHMANGGLYDQLGGGFHRYTVDATWTVPHFEKMLYDNALLARLYLHGFQATGDIRYRKICERTLSYMKRDLRAPEGGFYSAQDADSEGVEGQYYVWTPADFQRILTADEAMVMSLRFGVADDGNFEGKTILTCQLTPPEIAMRAGLSEAAVDKLEEESRMKLFEARADRVPPATDTKILTSWNGLAISALAESGRILNRPDFVTLARQAADFLLLELRPAGSLVRSYRDGPSTIPAFLEDYACLVDALLCLHESDSETTYLSAAIDLAAEMVELFWDQESKLFFDVSLASVETVARPRSLFDSPIPSGTAAASMALSRLGALTGDMRYEPYVRTTLLSVADLMRRAPMGFPALLSSLDFYLSPQMQVAIVGNPAEDDTRGLLDVVHSIYLPNSVVVAGASDASPILRGRQRLDGTATAYICRQMSCRMPTNDPEQLRGQLQEVAKA